VAELKPGTPVYVDGPHGVFSIDQDEGPGFGLIAGGVGIAGLISMLRTMADRHDARPAVLFYANRDWDGVAFREEVERLKDRLNLTVVHVLEHPPEIWAGETGYVAAEVLARHLPRGYRRFRGGGAHRAGRASRARAHRAIRHVVREDSRCDMSR
jgi:predicted ferric reductase